MSATAISGATPSTPRVTSEAALATLASFLKASPQQQQVTYPRTAAQAQAQVAALPPADVVAWGERNFYIPGDTGRARLIRFMPHQKTILRLFFDQNAAEHFGCLPCFQTLIFSTVKKSGKTAIAALVARWIAETWGSHAEVYCLANDEEQARGRIYYQALNSIELDPRYKRADKGIAGQWRIIEREAAFLPTHSTLKAVSVDYRGEAGSSPTATVWSELWGYSSEEARRFWDELTPVPTRPRSIRYVETYAGYDGESSILNDLEDRMKKEGYRVTRGDLAALGLEWPFPDEDLLPFYVHAPSRTFAYWDEGPQARRMPWQTPAYYSVQEAELRPLAFERLHLNHRVSNTDAFIPKEWWERLRYPGALPVLDSSTPVVVGADASVSGDCTALVGVTRDPRNPQNVMQRLFTSWQPQGGRPLDYTQTIEPTLRAWCKQYNVVEIAYDQYQLHDLMTRLRNEAVAWCRPFSQAGDRLVADKALFDMIRDLRLSHIGDPTLEEHVLNCGAKIPADDNTRLRLVKKTAKSKIDGAVALSMASHECLRLSL